MRARICFNILCVLIFSHFPIFSQSSSFCATDQALCAFLPHSDDDDDSNIVLYKNLTWNDSGSPLFIKIYVHIIRDDSAQGGLTDLQVEQALDLMQKDFLNANIFFIWDCEILPHDDDDDFYDYTGDDLHTHIFDIDPHADGVDIYFYPEPPSTVDEGKGSSQCKTDGSAFYVAGNNVTEPHVPLFTTHVVSHEMGHALGLLHTHHCFQEGLDHWECKAENPPGLFDNGKTAGDFIDDTPADPDIYGLISYTDCAYHGHPQNDTTIPPTYDPDVTNIMSYSNPFCMEAFSDDQVYMMRKFITLQENIALNDIEFLIDNRDIIVNTQWNYSTFPNGEVTVRDNITVKAGKQLTISDSVRVIFSPQAKLIIEPGGILYLNGTLTSFCNQGWKGVQVYGDSDQTQYFYGGHFYQGQIFTSVTAVIENAEIGIYVSGENSHTQSGGVVAANGTLFRNNAIAVLFAAYQNFYPSGSGDILKDNLSSFRGCTFEINDTYMVGKPFEEFIWLLEVDGIKFEACSFQNLLTVEQEAWRDYGIGIRATDATFHVNRFCNPDDSPCEEENQCQFEGLAYGIFNTGIFGNKPFSVKNSEFRDCYVGIYQSQVSGPTVIVNRFNLGTVRDETLMAEQFGYFIEGATLGMDVQENTFTSESGNVDATFGIYAKHLGSFSNIIRRDSFSGIDYANLAEGDNVEAESGMYYECNFNHDNTEYDFVVLSDTAFEGSQGIREVQGITNQSTGALVSGAGNIFDYNSGISESDFYNNANDTMRYLYGNYTNREPLYYSEDIIGKSLTNNNVCLQDYCIELCKTESELDGYTDDYEDAESDFTSLLPYLYYTNGNINRSLQARIISLKATMDEAVRLHLHHISYDTLGRNINDYRDWLERGKGYEADILYANSLAKENEWTSAINLLEDLPSKYDLEDELLDEHGRYNFIVSLLENAYEDDRSIFDLNKSEQFLLDSIRSISFSLAERTAVNILNLYDVSIPLLFQVPGQEIEERSSIYTQNETNLTRNFSLRPNPAKDLIYLQWYSFENRKGELIIYNIDGSIVHQHNLDLVSGNITIIIDHLPSGIYLYRFKDGASLIFQGKLIKI